MSSIISGYTEVGAHQWDVPLFTLAISSYGTL